MQKVAVIFIVVLMGLTSFSFMFRPKEKIDWITVEQLQEAYGKNPKPILIDVYTSWCGWCKVMDRETYSKEKVVAYINEHYYAIKLDAESKANFNWNGKQFGYNAAYKANDLAIYLMAGKMSYPTTVFLPELTAQPAPLPGYLKPGELEAPLKFFGEGIYKTKNFQEFNSGFSSSW